MKRRNFLGGLSGGIAAITTISQSQAQDAAASSDSPLVTSPPVVMAPRLDGVEVVWSVSRLSRGWLEWKAQDGASGKFTMNPFGMVPQGDKVLRVRISGWKPGTAYQIRAITEEIGGKKERHESEWKDARTLNPRAASTKFVVWNDTHQNEETLRKLHEVTPKADFLLWNGDICNDWHKEELLAPTALSPAGQDFSNGRPLVFVHGNHDVRGKWAFRLEDYIAAPEGRPFTAFRSGPVAAICLHTGEDKPDNHPSFGGRVAFEPLRAEQAAWLKEVTARPEFKNAPYRIVFCHIPLRWKSERPSVNYDSGGYDDFSRFSREAWHEALVAWKTQVVISGHTHETAWLPGTKEFPYAQLVGGGPKLQAATYIEGNADRSGLTLVMRDLSGKVIQEVKFKALA